ncbi:MAG: hypothetical protein ABIZ81_09170 [Opitutaceae bacterium]
MRSKPWRFSAVLLLLVIVGGFIPPLLRQRETTLSLRREIASLREPKPELIQPIAENHRLKTLQISDLELKTLEEDQEAFIRLRNDGKAIGESISQRARRMPPRKQMPVRAWVNRGTALPSAALETVLWAAAAGEVDIIREALVLSADAKDEAEKVYESFSDELRARYPSPEHWIAGFILRDVPLTAFSLFGSNGDGEKVKLNALFFQEDGITRKEIVFEMVRSRDGWRLVVPVTAVEKYAALLKGRLPAERK